MNKSIRFLLLAGLVVAPLTFTPGCGSPSNEAVAPEEFAPPPTEADERGEESGG